MATTFSELAARLTADTRNFKQGMEEAKGSVTAFVSKANISFRALGVSAGVAAGAIASLGKFALDSASDLRKSAASVGLNIQEYQNLEGVLAGLGVDLNEVNGLIGDFSERLGEAALGETAGLERFERFGVDIRGANGALRDTREILGDVLENAKDLTSPQRVFAFREIFGDAARELLPAVELTREEYDKIVENVESWERIQNEEIIEGLDELNRKIKQTGVGIKQHIISNLQAGTHLIASELGLVEKTTEQLQTRLGNLIQKNHDLIMRGLSERYADVVENNLREISRIQGELARRRRDAEIASMEQQMAALKEKEEADARIFEQQMDELAEVDNLYKKRMAEEKKFNEETQQLREKTARILRDAEEDLQADKREANRRRLQQEADDARAMHKALEEMREEEAEKRMKEMEEQKQAARELGLVFTSAFEDAIVEGDKFRDVLQGILKDIFRIVVRKQFTEPFLQGVSSFDFSSLGKTLFGRAQGGAVQAGRSYIVGEHGRELLHMGSNSGRITPMGGSGPQQISIVMKNEGAPKQARVEGSSITPREMVTSIVIEDLGRQGQMTQALKSTFNLRR